MFVVIAKLNKLQEDTVFPTCFEYLKKKLALQLPCLSFVFMVQQQEQDPTNLYISNLPLSMDEQELENMLKHFGQVISTRILRDSSGSSRGVGFARSGPFLVCCLLH